MSTIWLTLLALCSAVLSDPDQITIQSDQLGSLETVIERIEPDEDGNSERFQLRQDDQVLIEIRCHRLRMGKGKHDWHPDLPLAERLSDRFPSFMVVREWSGGAHCCFTDHIVCLITGQILDTVLLGHSDQVPWQRDQEGEWLFEITDWTFEYWEGGFASSPAPQVWLNWDDETASFKPDLSRMQGVQRTALDIKNMVVRIGPREDGDWQNLAHPVLDLIYEGSRSAAAALVALSTQDHSTAEDFLDALMHTLRRSSYADSIFELDDPGLPEGIERTPALESILQLRPRS